MSQISPAFFTQQLPKVGPVLRTLTADLTPEQARNWRDGPDGWNAIEVIAHLRDFERIFIEWAQLMLEEEQPTLPLYDPDALARERRYGEGDMPTVFAEWKAGRAASITFYAALSEADFVRPGIHLRRGEWSVGEGLASQVLHDLTHFEQLAKIRAGADR